MPEVKPPSRWQAHVWSAFVLKPALSTPRALLNGGWPIGREQLPNIEQIARHFPAFANAREALRVMPESDRAERALVMAVFQVLESLPYPHDHCPLAYLVDELLEGQPLVLVIEDSKYAPQPVAKLVLGEEKFDVGFVRDDQAERLVTAKRLVVVDQRKVFDNA